MIQRKPEAKACAACGRAIEWRKKWARDWENVRYCSDACRGKKPGDVDAALEAAILELLKQRGAGKSICPSEAARVVAPEDWEPLMERARAAAGEIVMAQRGMVVDPSLAKGPIRLRRK